MIIRNLQKEVLVSFCVRPELVVYLHYLPVTKSRYQPLEHDWQDHCIPEKLLKISKNTLSCYVKEGETISGSFLLSSSVNLMGSIQCCDPSSIQVLWKSVQ